MTASQADGAAVVPTPVYQEKMNTQNVIIFTTLTLGAIASAMVNGIISTTLGQPSFLEYFHLLTSDGSDTAKIGAMLGVFFTGSLFGLYYQGYIADRFGRKKALLNAALFSIFSGALLAGSVHIAMFIVFRFFAGFGASQFVAAVPVLMSELSPPRHRGLMVGMFGVGLSSGYSIASWFGVAFYFVETPGAQWRIPIALTTIPSMLILLLLPSIPESPRWLLMNDRAEEAQSIIQHLHGSQNDVAMSHFAVLEFEQMKEQVVFEKQNHVSWKEFLMSARYRRRLCITALAFMASQSAGILVVISYSAAITSSLGFGPVAQLCITSGYLTTGLAAVIIGSLIVDRVGRVKLILLGTALQIILLCCITSIIARFAGGRNKPANVAAIVLIFIYFVCYGVCVEGQIYIYGSELFPSHLRAKGVTFGVSFVYLVNIPFTTGALYAFTTIGWRFYLVFIICPTVFASALGFLAKETKGKTLEEIGALFGDEIIVRELKDQLQDEKFVTSNHVENDTAKV